MKIYVTKDAISHRGKTVNKGDIIEEIDRNHYGALLSVGCEKYDPIRHGEEVASDEEGEPEAEEEIGDAPEDKPEPEPEALSIEDMKAAIEKETGKKVHHKTGDEKVIETYNELFA